MITKILQYIRGCFTNIFNPACSIFARIDSLSVIDRKAKIYGFSKIYHSVVGAYTYIGRHTQLVYAQIGKFCSIAGDVSIGMGSHTLSYISTSPIFTEKTNGTGHLWCENDVVNPYNQVYIGNDVWIGQRAMIMGGVKVGNGAVIGAGAIVTRDIPPYAIAVGVPAKVIRYRFNEDIVSLLESIQWWNKDENTLKGLLPYFQNENFDLSELRKLEILLK